MIEYTEVKHGDAAVREIQCLLHSAAIVLADPLELSIGHLLRHGPTVEVICVHHHYARGRLCRVVHRSHQLVIRSGVADTGGANPAADVWLDHLVHFRVGNQRDRLVDVFQKGIPRELRRVDEVGRVKLVLLQGVVSEHVEHVGQQSDVAKKV